MAFGDSPQDLAIEKGFRVSFSEDKKDTKRIFIDSGGGTKKNEQVGRTR